MTITLTRNDFTPDGIFGTLQDDRNKLFLVTLEHSFGNKPKLYDGTFTCILGTHQLDHGGPFKAYEITGVQGHSGILFHIGNYNSDSDGCVLLGIDRDNNMISHSAIAFSKLMGFLNDAPSFTLVVKSNLVSP